MKPVKREEKYSYLPTNLRYLRRQKRQTLENMAQILQLKGKTSYQAYENGRAIPDIFKMMKLASFFDISVEELISRDLRTETINTEEKRDEYEVPLIPVKVAGGYTKGFGDPEYMENIETIRIPFKPYGIARAFEIDGDSMEPDIKNGSYVVGIKMNRGEIQDEKIYVIVTEGGPTCKVVRINDKGVIYLISKNQKYVPKIIDGKEIIEVWKYFCSIQRE